MNATFLVRNGRALVAALVLAMSGLGPANAAVTYTFEAPTGLFFTGSFSFTVPDFIKTGTTIPLLELTSCEIIDTLNNSVCTDQRLSPQNSLLFDDNSFFNEDYDIVSFSGQNSAFLTNQFHYFAPGAFSILGTHRTVLYDGFQDGILTISLIDGAVPEPSTWMMMLVGFGLVGAGLRRTLNQYRFATPIRLR